MKPQTQPLNYRSPLQVTLAVWHALFIREILGRLLSQRAAWLWMLVDPLMHVVFSMVLFSTIKERHVSGVDFALFLAIGVMGFKQFMGTAMRSAPAVSANTALLAYRQVLPVDTVLVRAMVEGLLLAFVTLVLLAGASLFGFQVLPDDPLKLIESYGMLWLMGVGVGLILSVINTLSSEVTKVVGMASMPLYFLSGVLYSPTNMPPKFRELLLYNPIVHGLELARSAFFPGYHLAEGVSAAYLAWWTMVALLMGLALQRRFANRLGAR